jgi:hypothetical protein
MQPARRRLVTALALAALSGSSLAQRAQRRVAWFAVGDPETELPYVNALQAGLREAGWEEGRNLHLTRFRSERAPDDSRRWCAPSRNRGPKWSWHRNMRRSPCCATRQASRRYSASAAIRSKASS